MSPCPGRGDARGTAGQMDKWTNGQTDKHAPHTSPRRRRAPRPFMKKLTSGGWAGPGSGHAHRGYLRRRGGGRGAQSGRRRPRREGRSVGTGQRRASPYPVPQRLGAPPATPPQPGAASAATSCLCCVPCPGEWALPEGGGRGMAAVPSRGAALTGGAWGPFGRPLPREEARQARGAVRGAVRGRWRRF